VTTDKEMLRMLDFHDARFTIGMVWPPEKQKLAQDMLNKAAAEHGIDMRNATCQAFQVFTLDEAIEYLKSLKAIQDKFDAKAFPGQKHGAVG
jgi:hypothetical protein